MKKTLLACLIALAAGAAQARDRDNGCTQGIEDALRHVDTKVAIKGTVEAQNCKPWPPSAGKVNAAVMAFEKTGGEPGSFTRSWTGVLALLDAHTRRILSYRRFDLEEDAATAIGRWSLTLDTADYRLASDVRALGLRFTTSALGPSAADASHSDELTLFVPEGRQLRPVLGKAMSRSRAIEGCLGKCPHVVADYATLTIAVGPAGASGWNDLVLTAKLQRETIDEGNSVASAPRQDRAVYRYNGTTYQREVSPREAWWDGHCCTISW